MYELLTKGIFTQISGGWKANSGGNGGQHYHHSHGSPPDGLRTGGGVLHQPDSASEPGEGAREQDLRAPTPLKKNPAPGCPQIQAYKGLSQG